MRRAWENSGALNATDFAADLQIAHDYRLYLDNAPVINALMPAEPESAFTTGWALTLLKAEDLGLNAGLAKDFQGGVLAQLPNKGIAEHLGWAPDYDPNRPDTLVLHNPSGGPDFRLDHAFEPG